MTFLDDSLLVVLNTRRPKLLLKPTGIRYESI
jgi:hypothetical protein